jgi:type I restriction enzyme M protein
MITGEIKSQVDGIWDAFAAGGVVNPLTVIEQMTYLIFLRRLDEQQQLQEKKANLAGIPIKDVAYSKKQATFRWSNFKNKEPETMFELFTKPQVDKNNLTVFEHMKNLGAEKGVFAKYMKGATFMIPTARLLDQVVQLIDKINMDEKDTKGDLYEYLLSKIASAGRAGQFRTPRHIIDMMVRMMSPNKEDVICDVAAGTCGFLIGCAKYIQEEHNEWFMDKKFRKHFNDSMFNGIEFDPTMLRIGAMNLQLHGIDQPSLRGTDALNEGNGDLRNEYTLILANPPFKGTLDSDSVEKSLTQTCKTKKTELLFLALMLRTLKIGGRCAVIVPDGVLFGSSKAHKYIRQEIVDNHKLDAIIDMPSGVFKPYAGVSTAIMVFTKTGSGGTNKVWFYGMDADGFSLDDKRNEIKENNIPDVLSRWFSIKKEAKRGRTEQSFLVPIDEIRENDYDLSINRYKEIVYEEIKYDPPATIIADIEALDKERKTALTLLKKMLK